MKRLTALLLSAALLITLTGGCAIRGGSYVPTGDALEDDGTAATVSPTQAPDGEPEQELTLVYYPNQSLNPLLCTDFTNRVLLSLVYQGLFAIDRNYNVHPMLCKRYTISQDMCTHTFYLEAATFSDGTRLTAQDVVASLNAAKEGPMYRGRFQHITSIAATADGSGVCIVTDTAYENLALLLDIPIVKASETDGERPMGTGPYQFDSTAGGLRLRRRNNWWCRSDDLAATATSISLVEATSAPQIRDEFQFADVGLVCADPGSDTYADYRCDYELWDCESGIFLYLACFTGSEIFSNESVRSALTYAIDRDALVSDYYRSFAQSATVPASPQAPSYNRGLANLYGYDPERFGQAVRDAGFSGRTVRLLVNSDDSLRLRVARAICQMLEAGGLQTELVECTGSQMIQYLTLRNYDLYLAQTKLSPNMDLSPFFYVYGSLSYGAMDNEGVYALCREALANSGNYYNLQKKVMDEGRLCPILFRSYAVYATRGLLTDLNPARDNVFFYTINGLLLADIQISE